MADGDKLPGQSPTSPGSERGSLAAMEAAMREEIRELHEQRAAAMMTEIVELQKERDLAVAKVRRLEKKVKDMEAEADKRRGGDGRAELVALLRQTLLEEQLISADLKKKLQTAKKQNVALTQQSQNETQTPNNGNQEQSPSRWRRHSYDGKSASPRLPTSKPPTPSSLSPHTPGAGGQSPRYSPSVVPRRYKLAAVTNCDVSTQTTTETMQETDQSDHSSADTLAPPILEALTTARADIVRLQRERDEEKKKVASELQRREELRKESECLQLECGVLRESLAEFSRWVRGKLERMEENMDIFRVIYSLHRSLSQEQSVLQELQKRLRQSEQKVLELEKTNRQLALTASEAEESSLSQIRVLREKLSRHPLHPPSLLTPPPPSHTHSSLMKGRVFSSPQLLPRHSSPLTTKPHPLLTDEGKSILVPTAPPTTLLTPHHPHTLITH
jgi:hypothetical protein